MLSVHLGQKFSNIKAYPIPLLDARYHRLYSCLSAGKSEHFWNISGKLENSLFAGDILHEGFVSEGGSSNMNSWETYLREQYVFCFKV